MALRLAISCQDRCTGVTVMAQNGKTRVDVTPYPVATFVGRAGGEMPSIHDEARADRGTAVELVLTGRRLPRFALLLTAMLAELTLAPFINMLPGGLVLVQMITATVLAAALAVAGSHRLAVVLFTGALLVHLVAGGTPGPLLSAAHALRLVFLCYVVGLVFRRVLADRAITLDTVAGAACAYMLLGLAWGDLFLVLESWRPGSFHVPATWTLGSPAQTLRSSLMYFSFATLTTVGYGEIHPNDPAAGSLCAAEAVIGQLYLAIMIARLVGLHTSRASSDGHPPGAKA
jgi:voltage-gated potassium channel